VTLAVEALEKKRMLPQRFQRKKNEPKKFGSIGDKWFNWQGRKDAKQTNRRAA